MRVLRTRRLPVRSKCEQPIQNRRTGHYHGGHFEDLVVTSIVHAVRSRVPQVEIVGISMVPDNALQRHRNPPVPDQCCPTAAGTHSVSRGRGCRFAFAATPNRRSCTPRRTPSPRAAMDVVRVLGSVLRRFVVPGPCLVFGRVAQLGQQSESSTARVQCVPIRRLVAAAVATVTVVVPLASVAAARVES